MRVVRHTDPDAFIAAAAPMIARGEASASSFQGSAYAMKQSPPPPEERVYLATFGECGAAVQRDDGPLFMGQSDPAAAVAFADDVAPDWPKLQGVVGALDACKAFARRWRAITGREHFIRVQLRQHALTAVAAVPAAPGGPRMAVEDDLRWLMDGQRAFIAETGIPDSVERIRKWLPKRVASGGFRIWEDGGPTAFAGFNDAPPEFARIAPVYTLPEYRGRGYATALVAAVSRELLARGKQRLFLATDVANPTSNAIYARIGFVAQTDDYHFDFVDPSPDA
jgi:predicted GNAT family acetyltransferase